MATENFIMAMVKAGGNRQVLSNGSILSYFSRVSVRNQLNDLSIISYT